MHLATKDEISKTDELLKAVPEGILLKKYEPSLILKGLAAQYVNFEQEEKWRKEVGGSEPKLNLPPLLDLSPKLDRFGQKVRIVARLRKKAETAYNIIIDVIYDNTLLYSDSEQNRNPNKFINPPEALNCVISSGAQFKVLDLNIGAMGGRAFSLKASYTANKIEHSNVTVSSGTVAAWRYLWVQPIQCGYGRWEPQKELLNAFSLLRGEYAKEFIHLNILPRLTTPKYEFADFDDDRSAIEMWQVIQASDTAKAKFPYIVPVGMVRALGFIKRINFSFKGIELGNPKSGPLVLEKENNFIAAYKDTDHLSESTGADHFGAGEYIKATCKGAPIAKHFILCENMNGQKVHSKANPYFIGSHININVKNMPRGKGDYNL